MRALLLIAVTACADEPAGTVDIHKHVPCASIGSQPGDVCEAACANTDNFDTNITCAAAMNPDDPVRHTCRYGTTVYEGHIGCCDYDTVHPVPSVVLFYECD